MEVGAVGEGGQGGKGSSWPGHSWQAPPRGSGKGSGPADGCHRCGGHITLGIARRATALRFRARPRRGARARRAKARKGRTERLVEVRTARKVVRRTTWIWNARSPNRAQLLETKLNNQNRCGGLAMTMKAHIWGRWTSTSWTRSRRPSSRPVPSSISSSRWTATLRRRSCRRPYAREPRRRRPPVSDTGP